MWQVEARVNVSCHIGRSCTCSKIYTQPLFKGGGVSWRDPWWLSRTKQEEKLRLSWMMGTSKCFTGLSSQLLKCNRDQMTEKVLFLPVMLKERPNMSPHSFQLSFFYYSFPLSSCFAVLCQSKTISPWFNGRQQLMRREGKPFMA